MDYIFRGLGRDKKVRIFGIDAKESISTICKNLANAIVVIGNVS